VDWNNLKEIDVSKFNKYLFNWHSKPYLKNQLKMDKVRQYILDNEISVLFLQEAGFEDWSTILPISIYGFKKKNDSLIIYKK
jgi:hypothetical protein